MNVEKATDLAVWALVIGVVVYLAVTGQIIVGAFFLILFAIFYFAGDLL